MKCFLISLSLMLLAYDAVAQKKPSNSKRATKVNAISEPPRMDGNTGRYDTVLRPRRHKSHKQATEYNYQLHSDTIKAKVKSDPQ